MIHSIILNAIKDSLLATLKDAKVALLFLTEDYGPHLRTHLTEKIAGIEKLVEGIDVILAGGVSSVAQEGFDAIVESVDTAMPHIPEEFREAYFRERAHFLEMKEKFLKMDELLEVDSQEIDEGVVSTDPDYFAKEV